MARSINYQDFSIRVRSDERHGLMLRVDRAPYGGSQEAPFKSPYSPVLAHSLIRGLERQVRNSGSSPIDLPKVARDINRPPSAEALIEGPARIGQRLFEALLPPPLRQNFLQCLGWADAHQDRALRLRLVLDPSCPKSAGAHSLPWELLYRAETRDFLSRNVMTPIIRQLETPRLTVHEVPAPPLRILVVLSSPEGLPHLDLARERLRIDEAWRRRKGIYVEYLENATLEEVRRVSRDEPFHVLHFMGHGTFDPESGDGALLFETPSGEPQLVTGQSLAETLKSSRALRLVFLNACETAQLSRRSGQDPYTGVASALVMGGLPMVLAMQFSISDSAAITFSDAFYAALAAGDLVETAVSEGRLAIFSAAPSSWEWITPVLFMSIDEGRMLQSTPIKAPESKDMSTYNPKIKNAGPVIFGEGFSIHGGVHVNEAPSPAQEAKHYRDLGATSLQQGDFGAAARSLRSLADRSDLNDVDHYSLALATLGRRRPFKLTRPEIREIEEHVDLAVRSKGRPHYLLFWAFLKYDYFVLNKMPVRAPTCEELVARAMADRLDREELRQLLQLLPEAPNNPIFRKISDLAGSAF